MNSDQQIVAFVGVCLIGITIWRHWRSELSVILFNSPTLSATTKGWEKGQAPSTDSNGNLDPNGKYYVQPSQPNLPGDNGAPYIIPYY